MMKFFVTLATLLFYVANSQCIHQLINTTQKYYCGARNGYLSYGSSLAYPNVEISSGFKTFTFDVTLTIKDMCSVTSPADFLRSDRIQPPGSPQRKIYAQTWNGGAYTFTSTEAITGTISSTQIAASSSIGVGTSFELWGSFDMTNNKFSYKPIIPGNVDEADVTANYGGWSIDGTTKFYFCSNVYGVVTMTCEVQGLSVYYTYTTAVNSHGFIWGGVSPALVGAYTLDEGTEALLTDLAKGIGDAHFGSSTTSIPDANSPTWLTSETGVEFTATNQYITIPTFTPAASTPMIQAIFTITFWIKIDTANAGYIFRYSTSNLATDKMFLKLNSAQTLTANIGGSSSPITTNTALTLSTWTMVTTTYSVSTNAGRSRLWIYFGSTLVVSDAAITIPTIPMTFATTDIVRIGGPTSFLGKIVNFRIYNPGSLVVSAGSCLTTTECPAYLGAFTTPSNRCMSCPTGQPFYYSECMTCPDGQYLGQYQCLDCDKSCATCTSLTNCQTCNPGYVLENTLCLDPTKTSTAIAADKASAAYNEEKEKLAKKITGAVAGGFAAAILFLIFIYCMVKMVLNNKQRQNHIRLRSA